MWQKQGLCGITLAPEAQTKLLYTKPIVAAVARNLKRMLDLEPCSEGTPHHHESGTSLIQKDILAVQHALQIVAVKMVNPFKDPATEGLICISTGVHAFDDTQKDLTQVK